MASIAQRAALASCLLALLGGVTAAHAADLRIGLRADPDVLDPAQGTSVAGRMVFAALCDKLIDTTKDGGFRPQLATAWDWSDAGKTLTLTLRDGVTFQDGEPMDAEAVKFNLERYRSDPISKRKSELKPVDSVEVVDPATVRLHLSEAYAPLIGVLADRAGMMMSPKAVKAAGEKIGDHPVCAGPFAFVSRVAQDSIKLERFADYWDKDAISIDHLSYLPIPDDTVRLVNLRSGDLDMIERLSAPDIPAVKGDANLTFVEGPSIAYDLLSINVANGAQADNPLGTSAKVRQAFELSLDREALNQVVYEGLFKPSNQHEMPGSTYWDDAHPVPARDVEKAKALLAEAGTPSPSFTLTVANSPVSQQVGQLIQAMAGEAGFDVKLQTVESATLAADSSKGNYQATMAIWSGRPDPDANVSPWAACDGFLNWGHYCNKDLDAILAKARQSTDEAERKSLYDKAVDIYLTDLPHIILYHYTSLYALRSAVTGFVPYPDGLVRLQGVKVGAAN
ncbi:ABC transporter substrate-binding protein [Aurantimonas sp. MSK8Z-1]|uniref:ABC transporter substrate-binding protein n=1 Tax=Mangrovibrevibacter kandeliae TaxID=2968473 RepID=UPI0021184680|nr:ABC transporter substrate-binding protein [Aurantimonas sp. MSK8Z-1]MCW4117084.1 ABC transporter substrate-binding protein [Aurantimonas sp. MSK8Z-1]